MKKVFVIVLFLFNTALFAQNYKYEIRMNNPVDAQSVKMLQQRMFEMFDVMPTFVDSTNTFYVQTSVDASVALFTQKILNDFGYQILVFNKTSSIPVDENIH